MDWGVICKKVSNCITLVHNLACFCQFTEAGGRGDEYWIRWHVVGLERTVRPLCPTTPQWVIFTLTTFIIFLSLSFSCHLPLKFTSTTENGDAFHCIGSDSCHRKWHCDWISLGEAGHGGDHGCHSSKASYKLTGSCPFPEESNTLVSVNGRQSIIPNDILSDQSCNWRGSQMQRYDLVNTDELYFLTQFPTRRLTHGPSSNAKTC